MISFEGDSAKTLTEDFHNAVDEYLTFCEKSGKQPERPFKGSFNVRIQPKLHRKAALAACPSMLLWKMPFDTMSINFNSPIWKGL
ncbi:type II toxin-antitoxin system HicB family antitoxin [Desulfosporosinus hippei]|uniref:type II toxin-antitoxin system HicB family antitoxin n=1 Tax=Desulfosporosinus hippei TaxID=569859 RepID=UPI0031F37FEB